jgi:hypothetical protein
MKVIFSVFIICSLLSGQVMYEEYFTDGIMQLDWHPWFIDSLGIGDSMGVVNDPTTPGGDSWAGRISNEYMGMAGLTYSGVSNMADYDIEAYIYTIVSAVSGPYNGIVARLNPTTHYYFRLVSDFDADQRLRLGLVGSGGYPVALRDWGAGQIPGGVPATSSWHKLKLSVSHDSLWCYYDDQELPGCPVICDSVTSGYFGIYTFNMADTASTKCDNIVVLDLTGIEEYGNSIENTVTVSPNPFRDKTTIRLSSTLAIHYSSLQVYDASGRLVRDIPVSNTNSIIWDGLDEYGKAAAPGVYFLVDEYEHTFNNIVKLH